MGNEADPKPAEPQNTGEGEGAEPQDPKPAEGKNTPNVHKLERDVANRDKRIAELEAQLKARADAALTKAGCVDCELGRTALAAFDGDVEKLAEAKSFLFKVQGQMGTGGKQAGTADAAAKSIKEALRQTNR